MKLIYIGPTVIEGAIPLPEGWPAADHDETDHEVATAKVASGMYRYARSPKSAGGPAAGRVGDDREED